MEKSDFLKHVEGKNVSGKALLAYLKEDYAVAMRHMKILGEEDERAQNRMLWCIGMKEMCEALLGVPVNLKIDGRVTIGFEEAEV